MIILENLGKTYVSQKIRVEALKNVNIELPKTGMVFILGKSGCGKSTLLNLLGGLDTATFGSIKVDGRILGEDICLQEYRNSLVGFVFQEFHLNRALNVQQNVALSLRFQGALPCPKRSMEALTTVGLECKAKNKVNELSGGEQQRVAIARAIIKQPKIILADEPTGKLDEANGKIVLDTLKELSKKGLVVVVSHDTESAEIYGDRIIKLSDGLVVSDTDAPAASTNSAVSSTETPATGSINNCHSPKCHYYIGGGTIPKKAAQPKPTKSATNTTAAATPATTTTTSAAAQNSDNTLKNSLYLAMKNIASRPIKTISNILVLAMLFAVLGLSSLTFAFSRHGALEQTLNMHLARYNNSLVITQANLFTVLGPAFHMGSTISTSDRNFLANNFHDYMEIRALEQFFVPQFFAGDSFNAFFSFNGVFELNNADSLGSINNFRAMDDFYDLPNVFKDVNFLDIISELRLPQAVLDVLLADDGTALNPAIIYALAVEVFSGMIGSNDLPTPSFSIDWDYGTIAPSINPATGQPADIFECIPMTDSQHARLVSWPEFKNLNINPDERRPSAFWQAFLAQDTLSFTHEFPENANPILPENSNPLLGDVHFYHNIFVTDFMMFAMYRRIYERLFSFFELPLPFEHSELLDFLNYSNFEAYVALLFNAAAAFSGSTRFRIAGIVDTGFKGRHSSIVTGMRSATLVGPIRNMDVDTLHFMNDLHNYYLMVYAPSGFASMVNTQTRMMLAQQGVDTSGLPPVDRVVGVHIRVDNSQVPHLMSFLEQRFEALDGNRYLIRYNLLFFDQTWSVTGTVVEMRQIFIPIGIVVFIISVLATMYFLSMAVIKKRRDIGALKALGASDRAIVFTFLFESLVTIILTAAISLALTVALYNMTTAILESTIDWTSREVVDNVTVFYMAPAALVTTAAITLISGLAATIYPVKKIGQLSPVEAIRSE